jgi:hypothetical protein
MNWTEPMDEPIEVEAKFTVDGGIHPQAFRWEGRHHPVAAVGRQWMQDGERRFLVMTPDERVFELAYLSEATAWRLRRSPSSFGGRGDMV